MFTVDIAKKRAEMLDKIRNFFKKKSVLEIETPILGKVISTDCYIEPFKTTYVPFGTKSEENSESLYLQTSPEFYMKKLLIEGFPDIFQICKVFRNGELGKLHNPEFTILEWYRLNFDMHQIMKEVEELFKEILGNIPVTYVTYQKLFIDFTGIDPLLTNIEELNSFIVSQNMSAPSFSDLTDALMFIMATYIESRLSQNEMVFVYNFPQEQAVLSVIDFEDKRVAHRFEVYFKGMELANGYEELTEIEANIIRLQKENEKRALKNKPMLSSVNELVKIFSKDLPPCAGVAVGIDRLFMCAYDIKDIKEVISFEWEKV
ncbi:MAG: EF-P lysine aminoacylase EpmA [Chitinispirillaceae bacterium]|nr:EF-P lysine aminoacylase EpmA [Chitinispirillaceae bacterium]